MPNKDKKHKIRLNKYIAHAGICSRRDADKLIAKGYVKVNGEVVTQLGTKVRPDDEVRFKDEVITPEKKVYMLLNKPKGFITTVSDPQQRKKVTDLISDERIRQRIYPVGRLDKNTTGLLLLTNDGKLTQQLAHPSNEVEKLYHVILNKPLSGPDLKKVRQGLTLDDGFIRPDNIRYVKEAPKTNVGLRLHSGRKRIIRRIFEHLGYRIKKLDRTVYAGLTKKDLPRGRWRHLSDREVTMLKTYGKVTG